ncbi:SacI homology domain-containing protein [Crepidotus variabilis]|uniref:SacI homology domain-containing protein n=1 Tax=Crepidotus variabilis TaxID=179855 RepID=A0A9P6ENJ4_9AGAR|nr:SacI homology domain-containing protein [Crepidotus variabilis]
MKKFFAKASKPFTLPLTKPDGPSGGNIASQSSNSASPHTTGLQRKDLLPPVPHPCPYDHLGLLVTKEGLLIRQHSLGPPAKLSEPYSYLRISWGKNSQIEEVQSAGNDSLDWTESVVAYGLVGVVELYNCSYLLAITSREEVGNVLDPRHTIYVVKGVFDIPLVEERATVALANLAARNAALTRPSLLSPARHDTDFSIDLEETKTTAPGSLRETTPRVKFLSNPSIKWLPESISSLTNSEIGHSIQRPSSAQSNASDISTPSSEASIAKSPVFKTLATRLSFWTPISKRAQTPTSPTFPLLAEPSSLIEEQQMLDKLMNESKGPPSEVIDTILASTAPPPDTVEEKHSEMETKVVRECVREFSKGGMYFAYNFDITRSLQHKQTQVLKSQKQNDLLAGLGALHSPDKPGVTPPPPIPPSALSVSPLDEPNPALPLWRRVDKQFWWNEWMSKPLVDAGAHSYILPIMQGFCQSTQFNIPADDMTVEEEVPVDYIIISRRSRNRPGLRYQRRGIDDDAHVANFVETETIMHVERESKANTFSYVQIRGSIPLFWTQTGYGLKPPPLLSTDRTPEQNTDALKRHFLRTIPVYGPHTIVNLAEQQGREGAITKAYRETMHAAELHDAQYCEYDFHTETKGMKYENIQSLITKMERTFDTQGYFWVSDNNVFSEQKGVFRVNCIDCLDRTNVVQSAFARYALNKQLGAVALLNPSNAGRTDADMAFNDVWANNGDAVSRAYAGTSALKGDFTRTGKRDLTGMLNDGVNSLARMYTSTFSDWFSQAVIDFMLGNRTISVFSEFLLKLKSTDPRDLIRLSKIRAEAIATSVSRVLPEGERLLSGWTLFSPQELNTKMGIKFEEKVMLLSVKALYIVSYDYSLEKVVQYTRIPLGDIIGISKGAYILSPLEESSRDPEQNSGFVITWICANQESRLTSYSMRNSSAGLPFSNSPPSSPISSTGKSSHKRSTTLPTLPALSNVLTSPSFTSAGSGSINFAAFKVLPIDPARMRRESSALSEVYVGSSDEMQGAGTCREAGELIVKRVVGACEDVGGGQGQGGGKGSEFVVDEDVVSLADAQRMTSMYAKMEYGVKRLLWLGAS